MRGHIPVVQVRVQSLKKSRGRMTRIRSFLTICSITVKNLDIVLFTIFRMQQQLK